MSNIFLEGLTNLNRLNSSKDFTIEFSNYDFETNKNILCFLSQYIFELLSRDSTINRIHINYDISSEEIIFFQELLNGNFSKNCLENFIILLQKELKIPNLIDLFNIKINQKNYLHIFQNLYTEKSILFILKNIKILKNELINILNINEFEILLKYNNTKNKILTEKQKFKFVKLLIQEKNSNTEYLNLFNFINFEELNEKSFKYYLNLISYNDLNQEMFLKLVQKLNKSNNTLILNQKEELNIHNEIFFEINNEIPGENGIIKYLRSKLIEPIATASSFRGTETPEKAIPEIYNEVGDNRFMSNNLPNQWLQVEFKKEVKINSYIMKSFITNNPSNFVLELSFDGVEWSEIDRNENIIFYNSEFKKNLTNSFICKFARIRNIGKNSDNQDHLNIGFLEFFGFIYD